MADPATLSPAAVTALMAAIGGNSKPDIVKQGGRVYQVQPDGSATEVTGIPPEAGKTDTNPTTIHVVGKGWLQYSEAANGWGVIQGTEETPEAPKPTFVEGGDGKKYTVTVGADGKATGTVVEGIPGTPAPTRAPTVVSPGQAVQNPDGTFSVPVADVTKETPAAAHQARLAEINQTAKAQGDAAIALARAKVAAGIEMTEEDKLQLQSKLDQIKATHDAGIATAAAQFNHDLAEPGAEAGRATAQQTADANTAQVENTRVNNQQASERGARQDAIGTLTKQAEQGQANVDRVVKAGSATPMSAATLRMAMNPLQLAFQMAHEAVATGSLPPTAIPTPQAPQPAPAAAATPTAPLPAPALVAPAAPAAAAPVTDQAVEQYATDNQVDWEEARRRLSPVTAGA